MSDSPCKCLGCQKDAAFLRRCRSWRRREGDREIRIVDLFSGAGGLSLGVVEAASRRRLRTTIALAVDSNRHAHAVYEENFPEADARCASVETFFDGELGSPVMTPNEQRLFRQLGRIQVLVGGPPCQGYSDLNNSTRRRDPRNALYSRMARAAEVLAPSAVLIENVPMVTRDENRTVELTTAALRDNGYAVSARTIDFSTFGLPQLRKRHVVVGLKGRFNPEKIFETMEPRCRQGRVRSIGWAISDLAGACANNGFDEASLPSKENQQRMNWLFDNDEYDLPNELRPICHRNGHRYKSMYGRLRWDAPAQTITTGFGSMGQGRFVHPLERRTISPHEAARLQTFPDHFRFDVVKLRTAWAEMIGNAVPPLPTASIADALLQVRFGRLLER